MAKPPRPEVRASGAWSLGLWLPLVSSKRNCSHGLRLHSADEWGHTQVWAKMLILRPHHNYLDSGGLKWDLEVCTLTSKVVTQFTGHSGSLEG